MPRSRLDYPNHPSRPIPIPFSVTPNGMIGIPTPIGPMTIIILLLQSSTLFSLHSFSFRYIYKMMKNRHIYLRIEAREARLSIYPLGPTIGGVVQTQTSNKPKLQTNPKVSGLSALAGGILMKETPRPQARSCNT